MIWLEVIRLLIASESMAANNKIQVCVFIYAPSVCAHRAIRKPQYLNECEKQANVMYLITVNGFCLHNKGFSQEVLVLD